MLQCVAVCCSAWQCAAARHSVLQYFRMSGSVPQFLAAIRCSVLHCVAANEHHFFLDLAAFIGSETVCCSVLQCVLQCVAVCCSVLQCVAANEYHFFFGLEAFIANRTVRVLQCVAVCCSVLPCVAMCCSVLQ